MSHPTIPIPQSYETHPTTHIKLSHYPPGSPTATPVVIVTLNRPEKRNAFTQPMTEDLVRAFAMFDVDERVKVIVLTGAGKTFCAGADLEIGFGGTQRESQGDHRDGGGRVSLAIHNCRKPTIAAMQGSAVGVGMTMTLPAIIRIAHSNASPSKDSKYGFVFARRGVSMEACSSYFLPRVIGFSRAMYLVSTGAVLPASSPLFGSLFAETYPEQERVVSRALEIATEIAENVSPAAGAVNRALMWEGGRSAGEAHLLESRVIWEMFGGRDQKEGVKAFFEKRKPEFTANLDETMPGVYPWWSGVQTQKRPVGVPEGSKL